MTQYAVRLDGLQKPGIKDGARHLITRGNAYPPAIATYPTREAAQAMADKCPAVYGARVIVWSE